MRNLFLFIALLFSISISFAQNNSVDAGGSQAMENYAKDNNLALDTMSLEALEEIWQKIK